MTETYRFANEYGDLTRLPLFSQTTNGVPHEVPSGLDATVASPPPATSDVDWSLVSTLRAQASEQLSQAVQSGRARLDGMQARSGHPRRGRPGGRLRLQ